MDGQEAGAVVPESLRMTRRSLLKGMGYGAVAAGAVGTSGLLAACGSGIKGAGGSSATGTINIGFITPLTGQLAGFASGDQFVLTQIKEASAYKSGIKIGSKTYKINVSVQDSQSNPTRAAQVAQQLITNHADLILTTSTPETTNPVAAACQKAGTPCLSTVVPWESWYAGLGGNPLKPTTDFSYVSMFFFGLTEFNGCFEPMWNRIPTNKVVACQYPNDSDGNAFRGGFEPMITADGYTVVDGGPYTDGTADFTSMISLFKSKNAEVFSNCPLPPDFNTFWKQASQQGFKPTIATVAKVLLFPADCAALGSLVNNIATDSWWGPYMPYTSSLTGQTASSLASAYEAQTGNQWLQSLGSSYALFEVAKEALSAVSDPHDKAAVADALHKVNYTGMNGPINFASGPAPGVGIIKPVGVQWKVQPSGSKYPVEMKVVDNSLNSSVPIGGDLVATNA
jgi:branched-chain amino acid transport system substrate-binding protein